MQSLNCWFVLVFVHHVKSFLFNVLVLYFAGFLEGEHFGCGFVEKLLSLVLPRCSVLLLLSLCSELMLLLVPFAGLFLVALFKSFPWFVALILLYSCFFSRFSRRRSSIG